jgi:short subunit dehydrogenase-like uncharacterized protein|tara:strand:+ start:560 stop:787 length:228 start_codon:yes stop_codon:yes gene_type:complete
MVKELCPRCKVDYFDTKGIKAKHPALSRRDNKTNICSSCGIEEAMFDLGLVAAKKSFDKHYIKQLTDNEMRWLND